MTKKKEKLIFTYRDRPLTRSGGEIYYGDFNEKYLILFRIEDTRDVMGLSVGVKVSVDLLIHEGKILKTLKHAKREGLFKALDIGSFWLEEALDVSV